MVEDFEAGNTPVMDRAVPAKPSLAAEGGDASSGSATRASSTLASVSAAAALAACGGGGGGGGGGGFGGGGGPMVASSPTEAGSLSPLGSTQTAQTYVYTTAKTDEEAARFLLQAQFSASEADIAAVRAKGYLPWLGEQFDLTSAQTAWAWVNSKPYNTVDVDAMIWNQLITSPDGVRKRAALAFSEIFVVSATDIGSNWPTHMMAQYWDTLVAGATTNFRKLLEDITLNPAMGYYLNTKGNQKENSQGRQPDENYAREVMQLMTLGLYQLNGDGTVKTDGNGKPLDSYTQDDVSNLARIFTGYDLNIPQADRNTFTPPGANYTIENNAWTQRPMGFTPSRHSLLPATFLGTTVAARAANADAGKAALKQALDTLLNHPNTGVFISKQLIQRMTTSNPSTAYVKRVADVFSNNGAGVRGDMKSVVAAVLLDNEARSPVGLSDVNFGRLREPIVRFVQWARTFGVSSVKGSWKIGGTSSTNFGLGQSPLRSPSVFNFFRPGYVPPSSAIAAKGMVAPEFQLVNETTVGGYINFMARVIESGFDSGDVKAAYAAEKTIVLDRTALVDRLSLLLTGNQLSANTKAVIVNALNTPALNANSVELPRLRRIYAAVLLVMTAPEYLVQK